MLLISTGTSFYIEYKNGYARRITYAEYLTLSDLLSGKIEFSERGKTLARYQEQHEYVLCPVCGCGTIRRDIAEKQFSAK